MVAGDPLVDLQALLDARLVVHRGAIIRPKGLGMEWSRKG